MGMSVTTSLICVLIVGAAVAVVTEGISGDYDSSGDNDAVYKIHPARILMTRLRQLMVGNPIFPIRQSKRGLGHCINNCMRGGGSMNFIQCKSLCH
ncbi:teretoxin Tan14.1-like isoform X1 [Gigantopelta aegis]|uniref:teretoxin Tan14.1-like isoform X1 n=1 Tax=Gigantopelta aegis TaxID=1735272 RepID=UPI001B88CDA0|nr:teretoxin Tan14.1-like isoform X1 [Gigantopelta aegis]